MFFKNISIRTELKSGDLSFIAYRQAILYNQENNYGISFEAYVLQGLGEFYENYDTEKDCIWVCENVGKIIGFLLLMHRNSETAQLRYFYLEPEFRGIGLGNKLMKLFIDFLKDKNYKFAYLWTTNEQIAAAQLYEKFGFKLTEEKESSAFGKELIEQRFDLLLD